MIAWKILTANYVFSSRLTFVYPAQLCLIKQTKFSESTAELCLYLISTHRNNFWFHGVPLLFYTRAKKPIKKNMFNLWKVWVWLLTKVPIGCKEKSSTQCKSSLRNLGMHVPSLFQCCRVSFASFACFLLNLPFELIMTLKSSVTGIIFKLIRICNYCRLIILTMQ